MSRTCICSSGWCSCLGGRGAKSTSTSTSISTSNANAETQRSAELAEKTDEPEQKSWFPSESIFDASPRFAFLCVLCFLCVSALDVAVLVDFFFKLKQGGVPVTIKEFLTLLEALRKGVVTSSLDEFYYLGRVCL